MSSSEQSVESRRRSPAPAVSFIDVEMSYDLEPVLHRVSFTVRSGTTTVVMGPSGVGKTTLVRGMLGLREIEGGDVVIGGVSVADADRATMNELRRELGVMLGGHTVNDGSIFGSLTAWENMRYPLEVRGYDKATIEARAWPRMIEFGLTDHHDLKPHELSGGTRRRLALARAFVDDPRLIVLDDPGTALDLANRVRIVDSIRAARASTDATVLLTCHDIPMTKALADDVVILLDGKVAASGPAAELLAGIETAEQYDERFSIRSSFLSEASEESLTRVAAERDFQDLWQRLGFVLVVIVGVLSLAAAIAVAVLTAQYVY